ncbi:MAG TPA: ATP-binding protein [Caulobacteraceae bacterium]|nr:ATP-binding protein [Caulobacteraceae bacterium]
MAPTRTAPAARIASALEPLAVALVVFCLDYFSLTLTRRLGAVAGMWPADGLVLGLMLSPRFRRPWTLLAFSFVVGVAAEYLSGDAPAVAGALAFANVLGLIGSLLTLRALLGTVHTDKARHLLVLLLVTGTAALLTAFLGAGALHLMTGAPLRSNILLWATTDGLGYAILTPLVQAMSQRAESGGAGWRRDALALAGFLCVLVPVFVQHEYPFLFGVPLGLFAVAYFCELRGTSLALLLTIVVGTACQALGVGPVSLVAGDQGKKLIVLQIFFASMTVSILPIAAAMAERRNFAASLGRARDHAVAEERRAREANRIVQMAEEIAQVGHWRRDLASGVSVWSDQMARLFGGDQAGAAPSRERALEAVHPADRDLFASTLTRAEQEGAPATFDVRVGLKGAWRDLRVHLGAERDEAGAIASVYGMVLDITDSKAAEAALDAARQAAVDAAAVKSEFLADMSHEIRTPLASILGFSKLLRDSPGLAPEARAIADRITAAGQSLLTAVGDILSLSKLEAGQIQITPHPMSPAALIEDVIQMLQPQAEQRGLRLAGSVESGVPRRLLADEARLRQVLLNLAGNALKFTAHGRVDLRFSYDPSKARMRVEVADTGPGIRDHERLFERYSQVHANPADADRRSGEAAGVGLGLAISKGLVEAMGGAIGVISVFGEGSLFWVEAPAEAVRSGGAVTRVLVADDLEINRELVRQSLSGLEVDIREACDGASALDASAEVGFDVILLDLAMPNGDGFATAQALRARHTAGRRPAILAVSAITVSDDVIEQLRRAGFDGFVPKPFAPSDLADVVRRYCR